MKFLGIIIFFITITFISCKSTNTQAVSLVEYHNKENISYVKTIKLKDRSGFYMSKSPYFTFNIDLKENGYADVVLRGWMVYKGIVKVGDPESENKKFILDIDNVTHVIVEFKDMSNAKASIVLEGVVQQVLDMTKI